MGRPISRATFVGLVAVAFVSAVGAAAWLFIRGRGRAPAVESAEAPGTKGTGVPAPPATPSSARPPAATAATAATASAAAASAPAVTAAAAPAAEGARNARHLCAPRTKAAGECTNGLAAWCDRDEKRIACCDVGLVATGVGEACGCPEGGPLLTKAIIAGCKLPPDSKLLTPDAIQETIRAKQSDFGGCYKDFPRAANVVLAIELSPDGTVFAARIRNSAPPDPGAEACVVNVAQGLRFPAPSARGMVFIHPLRLGGGT